MVAGPSTAPICTFAPYGEPRMAMLWSMYQHIHQRDMIIHCKLFHYAMSLLPAPL